MTKAERNHPCAFCLLKDTALCDLCTEHYQMVVLVEDDTEAFLIERDMANVSPTSESPLPH